MPTAGEQWCSSGSKLTVAPPSVVLGIADILLLLVGAPVAVTFLVEGLGLIPIITDQFCAVGAVYPGDPLDSDYTDILDPNKSAAIVQKYINLVQYYAWPQYCTCNTLVPPNTGQPAPPPWQTGSYTPTNLCSPVDLTTQLNSIQGTLQSMWILVSLIAMRTGAMSYTLSTTHSVTGEGELSVSGVIGVLVDNLVFQPGTGFSADDPARIYTDGFITFGNSDGWEPRRPVWHAPQIFLGATPGISKIAFTLGNAVSANIVELLPSPSSI